MNAELQRLEKELDTERKEVKELAQIIEELETNQKDITPDDLFHENQLLKMFEDSLDEEGDMILFGMKYSPSLVLRNIDETAYRTMFNDYKDNLSKNLKNISEYNTKYDEIQYEIDELQNDIDQRELTIASLEEEIEELEEEIDCLERGEE